jgi:hypothetical protein
MGSPPACCSFHPDYYRIRAGQYIIKIYFSKNNPGTVNRRMYIKAIKAISLIIKIKEMKRKKLLLSVVAASAIITGVVYAADHIDTPAVTNQATDITDVYVFRAQDPNNLVFVANSQGLTSPGNSAALKFDENTVLEFNIDKNGDNIEDLLIQCKYDAASNTMQVYGPALPSETGTRSKLEGNVTASVAVTPYGSAAVSSTGSSGIKVFAGPRDDPFFFDLNRYKAILAGTAPGFNNPGNDTFAGTNVLSIVVEVPKSLIGATGAINVWLETKKKI